MVNNHSKSKEFGDYSEDDLKNFVQGPYRDYAADEIVNERIHRQSPPYILNETQKAERAAQWIVRGYKEHLEIDSSIDVNEVVSQFSSNKEFALILTKAFADAGFLLKPEPQDASELEIPGAHIPIVAPRLWKNRDKQTESNPSEFVRTVYAEWLPYLARQDLLRLDKPLYVSYAQWVRPERHPQDKIDFAMGSSRIEDSNEAIERRRASVRAASARLREKRKTGQNAADSGNANAISPFAYLKP